MPRKQSAPPVSFPKASPETGMEKHDDPASSEVKCGQEGGRHHSPLKDRNPAPNFIGPWLIGPLSFLAWALVLMIVWALMLLLWRGLHGG